MLVFPAFRIQQQFRRQVFDEAFWMEQLKIRMKRGVNMSPSLEDTIAGIVDYEKSLLTGISSKRQLANMEAKKAKAIKLAAMAELASSAVKPAVSRGSISSQPKRASFADSSLVRRKPGTSESKRDSAATPDPEAASHGRASGSVRQSVSTQPRASVGSKVPGQHHRGSMDSTAAPPKLRTSVKQATM